MPFLYLFIHVFINIRNFNYLTKKQQENLNNHKLVALYNTISSKVNDAMKSMPNDSVWIEQIKEYAPLTKKFVFCSGIWMHSLTVLDFQ